MYHPRLRGKHYEKKLHFEMIWSVVYDLNNLCNEICEGNPAKSAFRPDTRLTWGMNKVLRMRES